MCKILIYFHFRGFYFIYDTDTIPQHMLNWSLCFIRLSRYHRYKDSLSNKEFWKNIESTIKQRREFHISTTRVL